MATTISPLANVDPRAELGRDICIGPFCVVGPNVSIGDGSRLEANVAIMGDVEIGRNNRLFPGVVIGAEPQDLSYQGSPTRVIIGDENVFREGVTVNRATEKEEGITSVGDHGYFTGVLPYSPTTAGSVTTSSSRTVRCSVVTSRCTVMPRCRVAVPFTILRPSARTRFLTGMSRVIHDVPPYTADRRSTRAAAMCQRRCVAAP